MSTETIDTTETIPTTVETVDTLTAKAREASLGEAYWPMGSKAKREAAALLDVAELDWYHAQWCGEVALRLLCLERGADADMWAHASTMCDEMRKGKGKREGEE